MKIIKGTFIFSRLKVEVLLSEVLSNSHSGAREQMAAQSDLEHEATLFAFQISLGAGVTQLAFTSFAADHLDEL